MFGQGDPYLPDGLTQIDIDKAAGDEEPETRWCWCCDDNRPYDEGEFARHPWYECDICHRDVCGECARRCAAYGCEAMICTECSDDGASPFCELHRLALKLREQDETLTFPEAEAKAEEIFLSRAADAAPRPVISRS